MSVDLDLLIQSLIDPKNPFPPKFLHRLSDLEKGEIDLLAGQWPLISEERKLNVLDDLIDLSEAETLVNFDAFGLLALRDTSGTVRAKSLTLLEYSEDWRLIPHLIRCLKEDPDVIVRTAALQSIAHFVYLGEVEAYSQTTYEKLISVLREILERDDPDIVRQSALEAIGYSSQRGVNKYIETAIANPDARWKSAALIAMGRSLNSRWNQNILEALQEDHPSTVIASIKAAGDMEIKTARSRIMDLLQSHRGDDQVEKNSAWSLARIGGPGVKGVLEKLLANASSDDAAEFFEECIDEYNFRHGSSSQSMFNFPVENEEEVLEEESENDESDFDEEDDSFNDDIQDDL